jgi:hypothetical protein
MRCSWILGAVLIAGCYSAVEMNSDTLRSRASFDLRCSSDQLRVTELDNKVAGVEGCGQRATYIIQHDGTWVMNSPPSDSGPPH